MTRFQILLLGQTLPIAISVAIDIYLKQRLIRKLDRIIAKWDKRVEAKG